MADHTHTNNAAKYADFAAAGSFAKVLVVSLLLVGIAA